MRGCVDHQESLYVHFCLDDKVPADHPLRPIKETCDRIFVRMRRDFDAAYGHTGRKSIPPEQILKALLLQAMYSIPSEIKLMEAIDFNLLYRWFLDLPLDQKAWTPEVFSMNRQRFIDHDLSRTFFDLIVKEAINKDLVSCDHFTVDGTLIRSMASHKSLEPRDGRSKAARQNDRDDDDGSARGGRDTLVTWKGHKLSNDTHVSKTDPAAMLARKGIGKPAELSHSGHVLMENRNGLCINVAVDYADGHAERNQAIEMLEHVRRRHRISPATLGCDAGYDDGEFLLDLESRHMKPHVPIRQGRIAATDRKGDARRRARRRSASKSYKRSQTVRKRVEQIIGWLKQIAGMARTRFLGHERIEMNKLIAGSAYNLIRMRNLGAIY